MAPRKPLPTKDPLMGGGSWGTPPSFARNMLLADLGSTGLRAFGGYIREEYIPNLTGRQGATVYREMLDNSPIVGAVMFAILGTMRKCEWRVEPVDDTPAAKQAAEFADSLRFDMSHTWENFITEVLSMLGYGYSFHEIVYKRRLGVQPHRRNGPYPGLDRPSSKYNDGLLGWARLPIRSQDTILKWFLDENGEILGLTQQPWIGHLVDIPSEKAMLFRPIHHKNNPEGRSILRNSYRPYFFVKRLEEGEAIHLERMSGNVVVRVPVSLMDEAKAGNPDSMAALNMYKLMATRSRTDEQMGIMIPSDTFVGPDGRVTNVPMFDYHYVVPTGGSRTTNADTPIVRHKLDILTSTLTDFITMGHTSRGAMNLADTKVDMFMESVEGWLDDIAAIINKNGLKRLWALNGMDDNMMPEFVPDMAQQIDLDILSNFILRLSQAGVAMFPDEDLEDYVRDAAGLPDAQDGRPWEAQLQTQAGEQSQQAQGKNKQPAKSTAKAIVDAVMGQQLKRKRRA
jgi:hypothetical protein